ncbi:hypothetical protein [Fodinicurvata sp. EGI_FJ10296]|uniref:hypothetical protein n=1 Tax=Fodinicurvata sp. EGI_FJ10296 TaxID=3231908 RepID=UPI003451C809
MARIEIRSEDDLFGAIERVRTTQTTKAPDVEFLGWPKFEITIRGESFDGGVPTRIMPALMNLQKQINRTYSIIQYGEEKPLIRHEKRKTELVVRFENGSTKFTADLTHVLNTIVQQASIKMDGTQTTITILGLAAILGGYFSYKAFLNSKLKEKELDQSISMSQQETERHRQIVELAGNNDTLQQQINNIHEMQSGFLKKLEVHDQIVMGDHPVIDGETAQRIMRKPRAMPIEDRIDGEFVILTVDSGAIEGGYRIKVRESGGNQELTVDVPEGTLTSSQIDALQDGEWGKTPVEMKINVKKTRNRIKEAKLIRAGLIGRDQEND